MIDKTYSICGRFATMLVCESWTFFGIPVVPLEYNKIAAVVLGSIQADSVTLLVPNKLSYSMNSLYCPITMTLCSKSSSLWDALKL